MDTSQTLAIIHDDIRRHTAMASIIADKIAYVQRTGHLPKAIQSPDSGTMNLLEVKNQIRRLNDSIYKTNKKLIPSAKPAKAHKLSEWQIKLDRDIMEREELLLQKKRLQDDY